METGELVDKALDRALELTASTSPELADESGSAQRADALVALARTYLGGGEATTGTPDQYQVVVHVEEAALRGGAGRAGLPIESVRRIACDADRVILVEDDAGEPLSIGRKSRIVPTAILRALKARDRCCRFPGCTRTRFLHAHHIVHWSAGGETSLANLMLLCFEHHRLVHEGGFTIEKDYRDRWFFRRPDGRAVPACGYRADDTTDDGRTGSGYLHAHPSAEGCTSAETWTVREPSAEAYVARRSGIDGALALLRITRRYRHAARAHAARRPTAAEPTQTRMWW